MLKELFESVVKQAHLSKEPPQPQIISEMSSSDGRRLVYVHDGVIADRELEPEPRRHKATSVADLVTLVKAFADASKPLIFVGINQIVAIIDDERRQRIFLTLTPSGQRLALELLPKSFDQRSAINFLRRQFHGTGLEIYADVLRQVVFDRSQQVSGNVQRNNESMGKVIEATVTGSQDLPEFMIGNIPVFDPSVFRVKATIQVGVDVRLTEELFDLWLAPDVLNEAHHFATSELIDYVQAELPECTVVRGVENL